MGKEVPDEEQGEEERPTAGPLKEVAVELGPAVQRKPDSPTPTDLNSFLESV